MEDCDLVAAALAFAADAFAAGAFSCNGDDNRKPMGHEIDFTVYIYPRMIHIYILYNIYLYVYSYKEIYVTFLTKYMKIMVYIQDISGSWNNI